MPDDIVEADHVVLKGHAEDGSTKVLKSLIHASLSLNTYHLHAQTLLL